MYCLHEPADRITLARGATDPPQRFLRINDEPLSSATQIAAEKGGLLMKHALPALVLALGLSIAAPAQARTEVTGSPAVTQWIDLELGTIASHRLNPPRASRELAYLSAAMYLAALAGGNSRDDAAAGAAATVLTYFHPDEAVRIDALTAQLADRTSLAFRGGRLIGDLLVKRAQSDGGDAVWPVGTEPKGDPFWIPTPPGFVYPPLEPLAGTWRTWNLRMGSQFRPGPPPAYRSPEFLAETNEVYAVSQSLTDEQKRIADFWADGAGTVTPPGHWNAIAVDLVKGAGFSTLRTAQLFSALNTAQADAFIACWDAKFTYWSVRPITGIRRLIDPNWLSYIVTPPFPSYPSGHSTTSGAASTVLAGFFPEKAAELTAMADEAAISRLYGGIHYTSDNEAGLVLGRRVGQVALRVYHVDGG
jgi:PAP2 superfamily